MMMMIFMRIMATWGKGSFLNVQTLNAKKKKLVGQFTRNFASAKRFLVVTFLSFIWQFLLVKCDKNVSSALFTIFSWSLNSTNEDKRKIIFDL